MKKNLMNAGSALILIALLLSSFFQVVHKEMLIAKGLKDQNLAWYDSAHENDTPSGSGILGDWKSLLISDTEAEKLRQMYTFDYALFTLDGRLVDSNVVIGPNETFKLEGDYILKDKFEAIDSWMLGMLSYFHIDGGGGWYVFKGNDHGHHSERVPVIVLKEVDEYIKPQLLTLPPLLAKPTRDKYFHIAHAISAIVDEEIDQLVSLSEYQNDIGELTRQMIDRRRSKIKLRSVLDYMMAHAAHEPISNPRALIISELHNHRVYLSNMLIDDKNDVCVNKHTIAQAVVEMHLLDGLIAKLTEQIYGPSSSFAVAVQEATYACHQGQKRELDMRLSGVNHWLQHTDAFMEAYEAKSWYLSGAGMFALSAAHIDRVSARMFAMAFGTALHMSQDVADFVPSTAISDDTGFKVYQDQFSDLKNLRLTLPTFLMTAEYGSWIPLVQTAHEQPGQVAHLFKKSTIALPVSLQVLRTKQKQVKLALHAAFDPSDARDYLSIMTSVIRSNKYIRWLRT